MKTLLSARGRNWLLAIILFYALLFTVGLEPNCCQGSSLRCEVFQQDDLLELVSGDSMPGKVLEIRKAEKKVKFQIDKGATKVFAYAKIHAVTYRGKRFVITPTSSDKSSPGRVDNQHSRINAEIQQAGATPPAWFVETKLNYPGSLELDWPLNASGGWNNQKNVGQFLWDVVYPNEGRWKSGIKLIHHCLELHQDDAKRLERDMQTLGNMYFVLLQDYERAAFWFQKVKPGKTTVPSVRLAECYWRLGDEERALQRLASKRLPVEAIKLFGEMKKLDQVERLMNGFDRSSRNNEAWLAAADAYRSNGQLDTAIQYYQKVLDNSQARNEEYKQRFDQRAAGGIESIRLLTKSKPQNIKDGTYQSDSVGYNGKLFLNVTVANGKITAVKVTKHREKQFYAALTDTPNKIIKSQSLEGIDGTSGATITSQAIVHATAKALANAPRK